MEWDNTLRKGYRVVGGVLPRHLGRHLLFLRYIDDRHANHNPQKLWAFQFLSGLVTIVNNE